MAEPVTAEPETAGPAAAEAAGSKPLSLRSPDAAPGEARLEELLPLLERRLPAAFAGAVAGSHLAGVCRHLPLSCLTALELRLGRAAAAPLDVSVRLGRAEAGTVAPCARPPHLGRFVHHWEQGAWPGLRWLWLEYDRADAAASPGRPTTPSAAARLGSGAPDPLDSHLLDALAGRTVPASQRRTLRRCIDALPPEAQLLYVFSMLSRPGQPSRLEIGGLAFDDIVRYLEGVAGAQAARRVRDLAPLAAGAEPHHLAFDVTDEVGPRFGIDCSFPRLPRREPRWRELLDRLAAAGLCTPAESEALLAWGGHDTFRTGFAAWPPSASLGAAVARALSHVKLITVPDRPPEAKAYLMLQLLPSRSS